VHPLEPRDLGVPNGNKLPLEPRDLVVPSSVSKRIYEPMVRLLQTMNLLAPTLTLSPIEKKREIPHDPRHLGVPLGASKNDFQAYGSFDTNRAPILHPD
jgi:hypothetical protein